MAKTAVLVLLLSQKLISRKIWMIQKSWNFHIVASQRKNISWNQLFSFSGIWRTNNFALGISNSKCSNGIFPTIARFNHSCVPNSEFAWNEKKQVQEVRALRKIETGEEITLCYFTSKWQLESAEVRKNYLFQSYGFYCDCKSCSLTGDFWPFTITLYNYLVNNDFNSVEILEFFLWNGFLRETEINSSFNLLISYDWFHVNSDV